MRKALSIQMKALFKSRDNIHLTYSVAAGGQDQDLPRLRAERCAGDVQGGSQPATSGIEGTG
jgi:hypothetical protein